MKTKSNKKVILDKKVDVSKIIDDAMKSKPKFLGSDRKIFK